MKLSIQEKKYWGSKLLRMLGYGYSDLNTVSLNNSVINWLVHVVHYEYSKIEKKKITFFEFCKYFFLIFNRFSHFQVFEKSSHINSLKYSAQNFFSFLPSSSYGLKILSTSTLSLGNSVSFFLACKASSGFFFIHGKSVSYDQLTSLGSGVVSVST